MSADPSERAERYTLLVCPTCRRQLSGTGSWTCARDHAVIDGVKLEVIPRPIADQLATALADYTDHAGETVKKLSRYENGVEALEAFRAS